MNEMATLEIKKIDLSQFGNLFQREPSELTDQELLSMDLILHRSWAFLRAGHKVFSPGRLWNYGDVLNLHIKVREEMNRRAFVHTVKDELDDSTLRRMETAKENQAIEDIEVDEDDLSDEIEKGVRQAFGSYGGKRYLSRRIAAFIPHHKTYVEPFAGGAAVFFGKEPSLEEALNDKDPEIAFMYRFLKNHTHEDRKALANREWLIRKKTFRRVRKMTPKSDIDRFYKNFYLTRSSHHSSRVGSINPLRIGQRIDVATIDAVKTRLKKVAIHNKDYKDILKEYDGPDTFFYLDPPYPETHNVFDWGFKEDEFLQTLKGLKGKWILSYPAKRMDLLKGYHIIRIKRKKQLTDTWANKQFAMEVLASKVPLKPGHVYIEKDWEVETEIHPVSGPLILPHLEDIDPIEIVAQSPELFSAAELDGSGGDLDKMRGAFKSPGGKYKIAAKLVRLIPEHKTFVEGFCGGAQVFFHKARSEEEILNDLNSDFMFAYRFIKGMDEKDLAWLKDQRWTIGRAYARKLFDSVPKTPREKFYRVMYLNKSLYWGVPHHWSMPRRGEKGEGYKIQIVDRLPEIQERLQGVKLRCSDWKDVVKDFDGVNTFFYLDPPYPRHWPNEKGSVGADTFNEEEFLAGLKKIRGKFLVSYELEKQPIFKGFKRYRIKTHWSGARMLGVRPKFELLVSNYDLKPNELYVEKSNLIEDRL